MKRVFFKNAQNENQTEDTGQNLGYDKDHNHETNFISLFSKNFFISDLSHFIFCESPLTFFLR